MASKRSFKVSDKELNKALKEFHLDVISGNILFYSSGIIFENKDNQSRERFVKKCFKNKVSPVTIEYYYKEDCFEGEISYFSSDYLYKMGIEGLLLKKGAYGINFIFNDKDSKKVFHIFRNNYLDKILENYDIETFKFIFGETSLTNSYKSKMALSYERDGNNPYELSLLMGRWFREDLVRKLNKWSKKYFSKEFTH